MGLSWYFCPFLCLFTSPWFALLVGFLGLVFSVPSQKIGWEEHLQSKLFGVEWDVKPCCLSISLCSHTTTVMWAFRTVNTGIPE